MDENEGIWHGRLLQCFDPARLGEPRIASPDEIETGSSLAGDDKGLVTAPVRTAAWSGLLTAVDHLALMADLAEGDLNMRPTPLFAPTRAALLGASQTVWVLSGNRPIWRARALAILEDERGQHPTFLRDYTNDPYAKANFSKEFMAQMNGQAAGHTDDITRIRDLGKGPQSTRKPRP